LIFGLGEGSIVAVAALPIPLGLGALYLALHGSRPRLAALGAAACIAWTALENPYLAPVLPSVAGLMLGRELWRIRALDRDIQPIARLAVSLILGTLGVLAVAALFSRSADPDYPREVARQAVQLLGQSWAIVDLPWARASPSEWFVPTEVRWTTDATAGISAGGGRYLGIGVWALAVIALATRARGAALGWAFAGVGLALSVGSLLGNVAAPFLFLNALMDAIARPLTQPTRFMVLAVLGLGAAAGLGVTALRQRWPPAARVLGPLALTLLLLESLTVGGLSLDLPTTDLPQVPCAATLHRAVGEDPGEQALLFWPYDGLDGEPGLAQLLQVTHGLPAPHRGIASWVLHESSVRSELRLAGLRAKPRSSGLKLAQLQRLGYRWMLVDTTWDEPSARWVATQFQSAPTECGQYLLYDLAL
jgi:hypothetical protein